MTKAAQVLVIVASCLAACKSKPQSETKDNPPTTPPASTTTTTTTAPAQGLDAVDDTKLPQECRDYKAVLVKLAKCDQYAANGRDALIRSFALMTKAFLEAKDEPTIHKALIDACVSGIEQVKASAKDTCGW